MVYKAMPENPYDNPTFANHYARSQVDRSKNRYEWEVTHPATLQFLDSDVDRVLDYGCGTGIFTAGMTRTAREVMHPSLESIGTDASTEMLRYAALIGERVDGVAFQEWDASKDQSDLQDGSFDRVFAKLVLNYVSKPDLKSTVMPRLRECLTDEGLLVAVLPNPLREAGYSRSKYAAMNEIDINVGNFDTESSVQSYHHQYEEVMEAARGAGFAFGQILGLPQVRFERYRRKLMKIAHPMPMIFDTLNAAKRWMYVFGATDCALDPFQSSVRRFENWRVSQYPEIADRAHFRVSSTEGVDTALPVQLPHEALYDYVSTDPQVGSVLAVEGSYAENLSPRQKIRITKKLVRAGLRQPVMVDDFVISK